MVINCDWCGAALERRPSQIAKGKRNFCDLKCKGKWQAAHPRKKVRVTKVCSRCGVEFLVKPSAVKNRKYCSLACYRPPVMRTCERCGKEYVAPPSQRLKYCSQGCYLATKKARANKYFCVDCDKTIGRRAKRCRSCSAKHRWASAEFRKKWAIIQAKRFSKMHQGKKIPPTNIEQIVIDILDGFDAIHYSQYCPYGCRYIFDEFIPPNTLLEINGTYWHSLPKMKLRDQRKASWARNQGYDLFIIEEDELKERGNVVVEKILERQEFW